MNDKTTKRSYSISTVTGQRETCRVAHDVSAEDAVLDLHAALRLPDFKSILVVAVNGSGSDGTTP